jgi:mitochondrial fission protein ELM1
MKMPKEKLEGASLFDIFPKEQAEAFWADDKAVIASGKSKLNIVESMNSPSGILWIQTDKMPYKDEKGKIIGIIGFATDITSKKIAEDELKKHADDLEKINQIMIGRENKMMDLKEKIMDLEEKLKINSKP